MAIRSVLALGALLYLLLPDAPGAAQAEAEAIGFDEAISLSDTIAEVEGGRKRLSARQRNDRDVGGSAQATQVIFMPGVIVPPAPDEREFEFQLNVTQSWNLQRLGPRAREAARAERGVLAAQLRATALAARVEAAKAWIDLHTLERIETLFVEAAELAQRYTVERETAFEGGVGTRADVASALAAAAELEERVLDVHGARFDASTALMVASGRTLPPRADHEPYLVTRGPLPEPDLPPQGSFERYASQLEAASDVAAARLAGHAARAREAETAAQYAPLLQTGAQLEHAGDTWVAYGVGGVTFRNNGAPGRAASMARAEAARSGEKVRAAMQQARAELAYAWHEVEHEQRRVELCEQRLIPALEALSERRQQAFESGAGTVFEWLDAQKRSLAAKRRCARATGAHHWARVRLWLLLSALEEGSGS